MSTEALKWVIANSPYEGAFLLVHIVIADAVDEAHENKLRLSEAALAQKARCSARTVQRAKAQMISDGFLDLIDNSHAPGKANLCRFLIPPRYDTMSPLSTIIKNTQTNRSSNDKN